MIVLNTTMKFKKVNSNNFRIQPRTQGKFTEVVVNL